MDKIIKTKDIAEALRDFSEKKSIPLSKCDFKIEKTETYLRDLSSSEFKQFNENIHQDYQNREKIIDEQIEFQQVHSISIFENRNKTIKINYKIGYDEFLTHPKILVDSRSSLPYKKFKIKDFYILLLNEINKIKAENKILINIFDQTMIKTLKAFTKHLYAGKFIKNIKIPLFDGIDPEVSRNSKLTLWFNDKKKRGQIIEVIENEILVEFIKPKYGRNGLNSHGQLVNDKFGGKINDLEANIDEESVAVIENDDKKIYKSKKKGYVHYNKKDLIVNNKVSMERLSRVQGTLAKDEDNEIEVEISQDDTNRDSVGEGVKLTSQTVHITGHIGSKSVIEAINLRVDGATHQDSKQFAKYASINRHKGTLRCHKADIKLLEGGEVHATTVNIDTSLRGVVYAQDVTVALVKNHLKVYASNSITIRHVSGEDNLFKINYKDIPILNSKIDLINEDIEDLKYLLEDSGRHDLSKAAEIKKKIKEFKKEKESIINSTKEAKITIEKPVRGLNIINFTLPNGQTLIYRTKSETYEPFYLDITEEKITLKPVNISITL